MSGKTIALDAEAYDILARAKKPGETFSQVVKRTVRPRRPLTDFAGIWKDVPAAKMKEFEKWRRESRRLDSDRQKRLLDQWK
ncbi:MAG: antitoxin VapB family protein [Thermoplasmata archaeon]